MILPINLNIRDLGKIRLDKKTVMSQVVDIFFENSNQKFHSNIEMQEFKTKWLDPYLLNDDLFYIKIIDDRVAGYINGAINTKNIYSGFKPLLNDYPSHLHINVSSSFQGKGLGAELLNYMETQLKSRGCIGVHVVTSSNSRNVKFYKTNGYDKNYLSKNQQLLFLGKTL